MYGVLLVAKMNLWINWKICVDYKTYSAKSMHGHSSRYECVVSHVARCYVLRMDTRKYKYTAIP